MQQQKELRRQKKVKMSDLKIYLDKDIDLESINIIYFPFEVQYSKYSKNNGKNWY
jgi:hypothetical protein